jgi:hypothetical protein
MQTSGQAPELHKKPAGKYLPVFLFRSENYPSYGPMLGWGMKVIR